jgi:Flp pilus assembly pilin Flp
MRRDEDRGSVAAEYALVIAGIAVAIGAAVYALGPRIAVLLEVVL